jgi:superfamily II DNA or RNA helicase
VQAFFEHVRGECSPQVWSRAVTQARTGQLTGKRGRDGSIEVRMATKGGMVSPLVTLFPSERDYTCECGVDGVCQHVAAAVIVLAQADKDGTDVLGLRAAAKSLAYVLTRAGEKGDELVLSRFTVAGETREKLTARLVVERQRGDDAQIATSRADVEIDLLLGNFRDGPVPRAFMAKLLTWLGECEDVTLDGKRCELGEPVQPFVAKVVPEGDGFRLFAAKNPAIGALFANGAVLAGGKLCALAECPLSATDLEQLRRGRSFGFQEVADLVGRVVPALRERIPVDVPATLFPGAERIAPRIALSADVLDGVLEVLPTIVYGDPPCARIDNGRMTYLGGPVALRDPDAEGELSRVLSAKLGLEMGRRKRLEGEGALRLAERVRSVPNLQIAGTGLSSFALKGGLSPRFVALEGGGHELRFETPGGEHATAQAVLGAFEQGSPLVLLEGGGFSPLPSDFMRQHGHLVRQLLAARAEGQEASATQNLSVVQLCEALEAPPPPELAPLRGMLGDFSAIPDEPLPEGLSAELRSYQREGYRWLKFVSRTGLGALLADDMGLGKTLQALCALTGPALVVCPASVLFNWANEIRRFRPNLRVHTFHGAGRAIDEAADVTLTTYATMRSSIELLAKRTWQTVVLDEAQTIKNPDSQVARAAFQLKAKARIALTGTPVENRLSDVWSIFHFLARGYLGGRSDFDERYGKPIADGDREAVVRLRARLKPLMLRRLKRDVVKELPPRTDVVLRCTLDAEERAVYDAIRATTQREIVESLDQGGSVIAALEALLRLRQAACHRALLPGQRAPRSSKLDLLAETLDEVVSEGHKALVFSQWTSLLDLVEPELDKLGIKYVRLDGGTRDRGAVVGTFQDDPKTSVMLLSLKAGGTGLNLTAADHVFLLDPWWNPAAEDQAADRAHRIGQERPVLVHRLVSEDTVEERILALQEQKRALAQAATEGAATSAGGITRQDLLALLA